jgi:hypothetical protein
MGKLHGNLVYYMGIWYIMWEFGIFFPFWYFVPRKIWQPWRRQAAKEKRLKLFGR